MRHTYIPTAIVQLLLFPLISPVAISRMAEYLYFFFFVFSRVPSASRVSSNRSHGVDFLIKLAATEPGGCLELFLLYVRFQVRVWSSILSCLVLSSCLTPNHETEKQFEVK
jgi:hypothetical protein